MNVWIVTIGSSDVQLDSDRISKNKKRSQDQYSEKIWRYWYTDDLKADCHYIRFEPKPLFKDKDEPYRVPPRVLGFVYQDKDAAGQDEIFSYLTFPLLDNFVELLKQHPTPDAIAIVLTDQSAIFQDEEQQGVKSAYWQDTCTLQPILERYFKQRFPSAALEWLLLCPDSAQKSLDNWNSVLEQVKSKFQSLTVNGDAITLSEDERVYVSHQAGTPALSSAVQFTSLARFDDRAQFLVSSEQKERSPEILPSSAYLRGLRIQEAEALLQSYNYAGVDALIGDYIEDSPDITILLNAAKNWNVAKFSDFLHDLEHYAKFESEVVERMRAENWWWIAYEEVYLAIIRREQGNTVESFFHSFRAFEGIFASWGQSCFNQHIEILKGIPYLRPTVLEDTDSSFSSISGKKAKKAISNIKAKLEVLSQKLQCEDVKIEKDDRVEMNLRTLCNLFKAIRYADYDQSCKELKIFWDDNKDNNVSEKRNVIVHQVQGMQESDLWEFWGVTSEQEWQARLLTFLNFIVREDFPEGFATLEAASLMSKVHTELERAIARL
jgi:hypothetical protein